MLTENTKTTTKICTAENEVTPLRQTKPKKKRLSLFKKVCIWLLILLLLGTGYIVIGEEILVTEYHTFESAKIQNQFRVVCIADMHNKEFGKDNKYLVERIEAEKPDIIAIVGDMNIRSDSDNSKVVTLLNQIKAIAPVYYVLGNHERDAALEPGATIIEDIKATGVTLLEDEITQIEVKDQKVALTGLTVFHQSDGSEHFGTLIPQTEEYSKDELTIVLCHYPEYYMWWLKDRDFDIMLAGHAHGGLIRIPFVGGLYAPEQGMYPEYTDGIYSHGKSTMVLTKGLGRSSDIPRVNNPPEILVLDIT